MKARNCFNLQSTLQSTPNAIGFPAVCLENKRASSGSVQLLTSRPSRRFVAFKVTMKKLTYEQWKKLSDQCDATLEVENDFSRPVGQHYLLQKVIREVGLDYNGDKHLMTRWVQRKLDEGYE